MTLTDEFLQRIHVRGRRKRDEWKYELPDIERSSLEDAAGFEPVLLLGDHGYVLIFEFPDGKVMVSSKHDTVDHVLCGATAFVGRVRPEDRP